VPDPQDGNDPPPVVYLVYDPMITDTNAVAWTALETPTPSGARLLAEGYDGRQNSAPKLRV
jgi:hypothetical protein